MFSELSDTYVDMAQIAEYFAARDQHGSKYGSYQEFHEVLMEEIQEASDEVLFMVAAAKGSEMYIEEIEKRARLGIKELAQVLAVIKKYSEQKNIEDITPEDIERMR